MVYRGFFQKLYTPNSIKVVFAKAKAVNYERARDDALLFVEFIYSWNYLCSECVLDAYSKK